ncbi:MAG: thioredoxin family protein [Candidatus Cloacimonadaceae bacterium]
MHNFIKIALLIFVLIFSLTACQANPQNDGSLQSSENQQLDDTLEENIVTENQTEIVSDYTSGEWITDYQQALAAASAAGKPVLVNFTGSDWCIWCKRLMNEVFTKDEFINYAKENLILLKLDFPRSLPQTPEEKQQNEELAKKFQIQGFPTILVLDKDGKEKARTGYQQGGAENYVQHLQDLIK